MNTVEKIIIYPIKSLGGINVNSANATACGFENDRRWMLVDERGSFQTQREIPKLSLFKTTFLKQGVLVKHNNTEIVIPYSLHNHLIRKVNVFEHKFQAQEVNAEINNWFSNQLNKQVQLVKMTSITKRVKKFLKPPFTTPLSLADGYPFLVLGSSSMECLNEKLEQPISHDRFRCNIYINTNSPHCEDEWNKIQIGSAIFKNIKPCARCMIPSINQQTGKLGKEPLKTLSQYRKVGNKINFGSNMILTEPGFISIGDTIKIL